MIYVRMPELGAAERRAHRAPIAFSSARVAPAAAAHWLSGAPVRVHLAMIGGRPVYEMLARGRWTTVFADNGEPIASLTPEQALAAAAAFAPQYAGSLRYDAKITD